MGKSFVDQLEENGFRVECNNGQYNVYEYSEAQHAYLFYGYYNSKKELKELLCQ